MLYTATSAGKGGCTGLALTDEPQTPKRSDAAENDAAENDASGMSAMSPMNHQPQSGKESRNNDKIFWYSMDGL